MEQHQAKPEKFREDPLYVLTPLEPSASEKEDSRSFNDLIRILWKWRYRILFGTLFCGVVGLAATSLKPKVYEAVATMIVAPPPFSTELKPAALPVEAYRAIAESPAILTKVRNELGENSSQASISADFGTSIQLSRERRNPEHLPLVDLKVRASSAELAQRAANFWATVLSEEAGDLLRRGKKDTLEFIEEQFPATANSLSLKEEALRKKEDHFDTALLKLGTEWRARLVNYENETERLLRDYGAETDEQLMKFNNETARLVTEHQRETERLRLEFLDRWKPDLSKSELRIKKSKLSHFEDELLEIDLRIKTLKDRISNLTKELQEQPKFLVQAKAITDDALWERLPKDESKGGLPESLSDKKIRSEMFNPVYQELSEQLVQAQIEFDTDVPRREHLASEIKRIQKEIDELSREVTHAEMGLYDLTKTRDLELETLRSERLSRLKQLTDARQTGVKALRAQRRNGRTDLESRFEWKQELLKRERSLEVGRLTRETSSARNSYKVLADKHEEAILAKSEETQDLRIGALAVLPRAPVNRSFVPNVVFALAAGFMLMVVLAFFVEYSRGVLESSAAAE